ncbi:MAG: L-dopachrome tautomerase-related protein [Verrucomicrobiota bacterium]
MKRPSCFVFAALGLMAVAATRAPAVAPAPSPDTQQGTDAESADVVEKVKNVKSLHKEDPRVIPVYRSFRVWNGIAISANGRPFVSLPGVEGAGEQLAELDMHGDPFPWPDRAWNQWKPGSPFGSAFVHVNAARFGPDGTLWVVDAGSPGLGKPAVPGAARLFGFDIVTKKPVHLFPLQAATRPASYIDDVRFNGDHAYLTDAGAAGLIVLDLKTGAVRRVLDDDPSTVDQRPLMADGKELRDETGKPVHVNADQLEVSPDGRYLYYQPASGPLSRIETKWLDDPAIAPADVAKNVEEAWANTPTSGGTAIDAKGNIYMGSANDRSILKITPDGTISTLTTDPRLIWTDAMWIDAQGYLWMPAAQLNRVKGFNGAKKSLVEYPVWIYKIRIGIGPPPNDHS